MKAIKCLDVTLRDGGCVIDFNFGSNYMCRILAAIEASGADYIELGYIDNNKGTEKERTQFLSEKSIRQNFLKKKKTGHKYLAMMDYGKYKAEDLEKYREDGIDGIRLAFHKKDWRCALDIGKQIYEKGYEVFLQPMITMRYTDQELLELIAAVNNEFPQASAFYLVDSFGEMRQEDVSRLIYLIDHNLNREITIGFHSHNNLQLSYANAISLLNFPMNRDLIIDSSVLGMGKGAGNLNTELFMEHLNRYYGKNYEIKPLLNIIDKVLKVIHSESNWGYSVEYYLSSVNGCSSSYASYYYNKHRLSVEKIAELLGYIDEEKKISFDRDYAEKLYISYNGKQSVDDGKFLKQLKKDIEGKTVLIIGPGKSIIKFAKQIEETRKKCLTIALNIVGIDADYHLITREDLLQEAIERGHRVIALSNIAKEVDGEAVGKLNYKEWTVVEKKAQDSAGVIALSIISRLQASEILIAGLDGFRPDIDDNYYDKALRSTISAKELKENNRFMSEFINKIKTKIPVRFLTPSLYQESGKNV